MIKRAKENRNAKVITDQLPTAIIRWYPFEKSANIAYIGKADSIYRSLSERAGDNVTRVPFSETLSTLAKNIQRNVPKGRFDYIVCIGYCEKIKDFLHFLKEVKKHLSKKGKLILGVNNRLALRYFCGDSDVHTGQVLDGIDDYFRAYNKEQDIFNGRSYDKAQLVSMLEDAGLKDHKFYSVFPGLEHPMFIFAEGYRPNEDLCNRNFPIYNNKDTLFLEEPRLYKGLVDNDLLHVMANGFLIECSVKGAFSDALQITTSLDRGKEKSLITIIHGNGTVTKEAAYEEGKERLGNLITNAKKLKKRGIDVIDAKMQKGIYTMPFIDAPTGQIYMEELLRTDKEAFIRKMDEFRQLLLKSSESYTGIYKEPAPEKETKKQRLSREKREKKDWLGSPVSLLKDGMLDLVPLNSLYVDDHFVFFDQEFCIPDLPVDVLVTRMIFTFYSGTPGLHRYLDPDFLYKRYNIPNPAKTEGGSKYLNIDFRFLGKVMNRDILSGFYSQFRADANVINANRQRMNFSTEEYERLFVDIFDKADERKLILFGSGIFAKRFLALYGDDYKVYAVVDNNESRWGQKIYPEGYEEKRASKTGSLQSETDSRTGDTAHDDGVTISSPDILKDLHHGEYKILICIKNYLSVMNQLEGMGIHEYSIFDPSKAYPRKRHPISPDSVKAFEHSTVPEGGKKYHTGYIAGVFDLYHIGHLNMFRRAKEMCDYLIVGVVTDEGVRDFKGVEPFVPFDERVEMIKSCRYVDEVVEIPYIYGGSEDSFRLHHFDVQFSGSDYVNNPDFLKYKKFLEENGATLEFFPYTESTSSTKLKQLIEKKLL